VHIRIKMTCPMPLTDIQDRSLPAETGGPGWDFSDSYYKRVLRRLKELPVGHPDKAKFTMEQARLRCGDDSRERTYLRDLVEPFDGIPSGAGE
jgi:hypothetical protein